MSLGVIDCGDLVRGDSGSGMGDYVMSLANYGCRDELVWMDGTIGFHLAALHVFYFILQIWVELFCFRFTVISHVLYHISYLFLSFNVSSSTGRSAFIHPTP